MNGAGVALALALASAVVGAPVLAAVRQPENILPPDQATPVPTPTPASTPVTAKTRSQSPVARAKPAPAASPSAAASVAAGGSASPGGAPLAQSGAAQPAAPQSTVPQPGGPVPVEEPVMQWSASDAIALLEAINAIDREGLDPADYQPDKLGAAIAAGAGAALDAQASRSFDWLAEDLRDGRTPMDARIQWFAVDTDQDTMPTRAVLARALATHDIAGTLAGLDPTYPDYAALREALAVVPAADTKRRALIRINMDRWRWLPRDLGEIYLLANVPEYELRLMRGNNIVRTYKTIVGKPGRTATPQLAEEVKAVVFNPTWTVPQSIIEHEGLADKLRAHPRPGFKVTDNTDGSVTIVQQPGPNNSLGQMKIDMPNPHAIYLHDTPQKALFNEQVRAFSHGCIRTERAVELGMTMAMMGANMTIDKAVALYNAGKYARVPMVRTFPVYITYFTVGHDITGQMSIFNDIYGRDAPVLASFAAPRQQHTTQRTSTQEVIVAQDPL